MDENEEDLNNEISDMKTKLATSEAMRQRYEVWYESSQGKNKELQQALDEGTAQRKELQAKIKTLEAQLKAAEQKVNEYYMQKQQSKI